MPRASGGRPSTGTFATRDDLVEAVLEEVLERGRQATGGAQVDPTDPAASLRRMSKAYLDVAFEFGQLIQRRDGSSAAVEAAKDTEESPTRRFLDEGRRLGTIRTDLPRHWQQTVMRTVTLTAIEEVEGGALTQDEAREVVGTTLITLLVADGRG